ncbi:MAG: hypothetical protein RR561_06425 [Peptostreptococcus sp.]|uniref:hypothetical protein n=1 Tax=Peptostreptococcus sp. TaxID=1262 RepID=UPI002FC9332A
MTNEDDKKFKLSDTNKIILGLDKYKNKDTFSVQTTKGFRRYLYFLLVFEATG